MLYSNRSSLLASKKRKLFLHKYLQSHHLNYDREKVLNLIIQSVDKHW